MTTTATTLERPSPARPGLSLLTDRKHDPWRIAGPDGARKASQELVRELSTVRGDSDAHEPTPETRCSWCGTGRARLGTGRRYCRRRCSRLAARARRAALRRARIRR